MGEHGVFLGIEDDGIGGEIEADFFPVDLHLRRRKGGLEAVGGALIVGTERNGVAALHFEPDFVVVLADLGKFLVNWWFDHLVVAAGLRRHDSPVRPQLLVIDIEGEGTVQQKSPALQEHIVGNLMGGADGDFDAIIRRMQVEAGRCN